METKRDSRQSVPIRFPKELRERLDALNDRDDTSIQHAVVTALEPYLTEKGFPKDQPAEKRGRTKKSRR